MAKQGLEDIFKSIAKTDEETSRENTLKMLYRCLKEYEMIGKANKIFDMIKSKHLIFTDIMWSLDP